MIAIITSGADPHADRVEAVLDSRGVRHVRVDYESFPRTAVASARLSPGATELLRWRGIDAEEITGTALTSIWWRRPGRPRPAPKVVAPGAAAFVASEAADFLDDLWDLHDVPALPAPRPVVRRAQRKIRQLSLARTIGWELPATLVTNDPSEAADFARERGAVGIVSKQAGFTEWGRTDPDSTEHWDAYVRYTERVTTRDLAHLEALRLCPIILQGEVPKQYELRVTLVGQRLFPVAIRSQENPRTALDWRRYDDRATPHEIVPLPEEVAQRCRRTAAALGLRYAAFDLAVTPDRRYVFIEVNPSGQYLWLEDLTGAPISAAIADELARPARPAIDLEVAA